MGKNSKMTQICAIRDFNVILLKIAKASVL